MIIAYEASTINKENMQAIKDKLGPDLDKWAAPLVNYLNKKDELYCIVFNFFGNIDDESLNHTITHAWKIDQNFDVAIFDKHFFWIRRRKY